MKRVLNLLAVITNRYSPDCKNTTDYIQCQKHPKSLERNIQGFFREEDYTI